MESEHIGTRYARWIHDVEPDLTPAEKAAGHEAFATEFEALPPNQQPSPHWAETMAYLCRRIARRRRGEPVPDLPIPPGQR